MFIFEGGDLPLEWLDGVELLVLGKCKECAVE